MGGKDWKILSTVKVQRFCLSVFFLVILLLKTLLEFVHTRLEYQIFVISKLLNSDATKLGYINITNATCDAITIFHPKSKGVFLKRSRSTIDLFVSDVD